MSQIECVLARPQLLALLRRVTLEAVPTASQPLLRVGVGISTAGDRVELIERASVGDSWIGLIGGSAEEAERRMRNPDAGCVGMLSIGRKAARGTAGGFCNIGQGLQPIDALRPVGAGMHRIMLGGNGADPNPLPDDPVRLERWSRTIGALGLDGWRRLTRLHVAVIGSGSAAGALKTALLRIGAQRLTHVDAGGPEDRRDALDSVRLEALKPSELIVLAAEQAAARAGACAVAAVYGKPVLDVAAFAGRSAATVSLVLPGQGHCLDCVNSPRMRDHSHGGAAEDAATEDFAVGIALRMLEDLVIERIETSLVAQIGFDDRGRLTVEYPPIAGRVGCGICAWAGTGDGGIGRFLNRERVD